MKKKIIFVNSIPAELDALKRMLKPFNARWECQFESTAAAALPAMEAQAFDVLATDLHLSDMEGLQLLNTACEKHPALRAIIMADLTESGLNLLGTLHQIISKPLDMAVLEASLERALDSSTWKPSETAKKLAAQMTRLPSQPYLYFRVLRELRAADPSLEDIGNLIAHDPAMSAKLLQLANSAALGLAQKVVHPTEAVLHLGFKRTQSMLLLAHTCSFFDQIKDTGFSVDRLWQHSIRVAQYARLILKTEGQSALAEEAFTAGLLHDIGKLAIGANLAAQYREAVKLAHAKNITELEAETSVFGATHAEIAACLLVTWGLPWSIVTAVAFHHTPMQGLDLGFSPLTGVHVADFIDHSKEANPNRVNKPYLLELGYADSASEWRRLCLSSSERL